MFEDTCGNLKKIIAKSEIFFFLFIGYEMLSFSALHFELTTFMLDVLEKSDAEFYFASPRLGLLFSNKYF